MDNVSRDLRDDDDDDQLIDAVRAGDSDAFGVLFARHRAIARRVAVRHGRPGEVDDVVAEAFVGVLGRVRAGGGPVRSFRAYLLTAVRHEAARRSAVAGRCVPVGDVDPWVVAAETTEAGDRLLEAYATLPERWRSTLWQLEVEGRRPHELAAELGISPNAVSALGYRARTALRTAFLELPDAA